ncbi:MAG: hypothetical protein ACK5PU_04840, partial [bacterium]
MDLVIKGNCIVTPHAIGPAEIGIAGEKIVAIAAPGSLPMPPGARVVEAGDSIVMPGGIDPHTHCLWPIPGPDGKIDQTQGASVVGKAALYGGTTSILDFVRWTHGK